MAEPVACVGIEGQQQTAGAGAGEVGDERDSDVGQVDFDELLHSNVLDTLADFDFSCGDLSALEPDPKAICTPDGVRRRTFAVSQASALAAGVWGSATAAANHAPEQSTPSQHSLSCINGTIAPSSLVPHGNSTVVETGLVTDYLGTAAQLGCGEKGGKQENATTNEQILPQQRQQQQRLPSDSIGHGRATLKLEGHGAVVPSVGANSGKKRKASGIGGGKRPLNPERMERKASREKRRREEVNEKFEQLLEVLEEAEATSGLEPPVPEDGQQTHSCINGRRVEVLHRTISILRKLLRDRRDRSIAVPAMDDAAPICVKQPVSLSQQQPVSQPTYPSLCFASRSEHGDATLPASAPAIAVSEGASAEPSSETTSPAAAAVVSATGGPPPPNSNAQATEAATEQQQHIAAHSSSDHAPRPSQAMPSLPPGFALAYPHGMAMPTGAVGTTAAGHVPTMHPMPQHPNGQGRHPQPIFIAVPMFMPPGQGVGQGSAAPAATAAGTTAANASGERTPAAPAVPALAPAVPGGDVKGAGEVKPARCPQPTAATAAAAKNASADAANGKESWPVPGALGFPQMMALQMPQFVTQALATDDGEKVTHAMCA